MSEGKKSKSNVRKYNLLTFSEDEASLTSDIGVQDEAIQENDKTEYIDNQTVKTHQVKVTGNKALEKGEAEDESISDISMDTSINGRKHRHDKDKIAVTDIESNRNASDKRKAYSERQNSSLCEKILASKSKRLANMEKKLEQNYSKETNEPKSHACNEEDLTASGKAWKNSDNLIDNKSKENNAIEEIVEINAEEEENNHTEQTQKNLNIFENGPIPLEKQVKFCQERVAHIEKNYGAFCETLGSITRKIARLRDKGDLLSKQVVEFTDRENVSVSTKKNLKDFAHNLAAIQDYRDAEIHRLDSKVVKPLSAYGPKCKKIKQIIKTEQSAINREIKQRKNLEKVRDKKPGDAHSIAETELQKAAADAAIGSKGLQNQMAVFEKDKLADLKKILADFVSVEMIFHAKAIEYYSQCFENLAMIDEEEDLQEFSRKLNLTQAQGSDTLGSSLPVGATVPQGTITSLGSTVRSSTMETTGTSEYTSTGESYTYTYGESTGSSGEKRVRIQNQSMYADVEDDYDDEDDDDDEDDEDDSPQLYSRPVKQR